MGFRTKHTTACAGFLLEVLEHELEEWFILVVRRNVQEVIFAVHSLIYHLETTAEHGAHDFISLLNADLEKSKLAWHSAPTSMRGEQSR